MMNTIGQLSLPEQHQKRLRTGQQPVTLQQSTGPAGDRVSLHQQIDISMTYSSSLSIQSGDGQEQYTLLRELVSNMLKEQGIDFKVAAGDQEIDISTISEEEAVELIADDGYFGVEQTSDRIVDLAISAAGDDPARLGAIKEGIEKGFNDALEAFGGWLPDISYDTLDAVMNKLDAWAEQDSPSQES